MCFLFQPILLAVIPMVHLVCSRLSIVGKHTPSVQMLVTLCCGVQQLTIILWMANGETVFQAVSSIFSVIVICFD